MFKYEEKFILRGSPFTIIVVAASRHNLNCFLNFARLVAVLGLVGSELIHKQGDHFPDCLGLTMVDVRGGGGAVPYNVK